MALIQNELGEFVNDFDPYETDRKKIYANCHVDTKYQPKESLNTHAKVCGECGKLFIPSRSNEKYCSKQCKADAKLKLARIRYRAKKGGADG